jgi:hypothetical protein
MLSILKTPPTIHAGLPLSSFCRLVSDPLIISLDKAYASVCSKRILDINARTIVDARVTAIMVNLSFIVFM